MGTGRLFIKWVVGYEGHKFFGVQNYRKEVFILWIQSLDAWFL